MFDSTHTRTTLNDNASASSGANSFSGFSAYSAGTSHTFHTVAESTVAQIFGSTKVKFHGRQKELNILHGIYNEVCGRISGRSKDSNTNTKNDSHLQQEIQITDKFPDNHSTASASKSTISTTSTPANIRRVALVSGISGAGKSALVRHFIKELRTKKDKISRTITNDKVDDGGCDGDNDGENGHESGNQNDTTEPIFLHGKFDELAGADPFSAIVEAFTGLAPLLLEGRTETDDEDDEDGMHNEFAQDLVRIQKDVRICLRPEDV